MILALAQTNIIWEDKEKNLAVARTLCERLAAYRQAEHAQEEAFLLFPEMSLTGFSMHTEKTAETDMWTVAQIKTLAKEYKISVGIGWVKGGDSLCENRYSLIGSDGEESLSYAKIHPFSYGGEDRYFKGGDALPATELAGFSVGCAICYDLRFSQIFDNLASRADLIFVPANWPAKRREHWNTLLLARAIETQCYVAGVNCCGDMDGASYTGDSCVIAPDGTLLAPEQMTELGGNRLFVYRIENDVEAYRAAFPVRRDRRDLSDILKNS